MRLISKINRGLICTVVVILAVVIYVLSVSAMQNAQKPEIKKVCKSFIDTYLSYTLLPQSYMNGTVKMPSDEKEKYKAFR